MEERITPCSLSHRLISALGDSVGEKEIQMVVVTERRHCPAYTLSSSFFSVFPCLVPL